MLPMIPAFLHLAASLFGQHRTARETNGAKTKWQKKFDASGGPGRPLTTGKGVLVGMRCHSPFLSAGDRWRAGQADKPSRPAAIVRLAEIGLMSAGHDY